VAAGCDAWAKSAAEAHAEGNFGNRPLIVLTAGRAFTVGAPQAGEELKAFHEIWTHLLQVRPTQLSTLSFRAFGPRNLMKITLR